MHMPPVDTDSNDASFDSDEQSSQKESVRRRNRHKREKPAKRRDRRVGGEVYGAAENLSTAHRYVFSPLIKHGLPLFLVILVLVFLAGYGFIALRTVFSPFCVIPGLKTSLWCVVPAPPPIQQVDFQGLMGIEVKSFNQLLDQAAGGNSISLNVKKAELATKDLAVLVQYSDLRQRDLLARTLVEFAQDARTAGRNLVMFDAKLRAAVDTVVTVNDYALRTIEEAEGRLSREWLPELPVGYFSKSVAQGKIIDTFAAAMNVLSKSAQDLILNAEERRSELEALQDKLNIVHNIAVQEGARVNAGRQKLHSNILATLWTNLGGNNKKIMNFREQLQVLGEVETYRKQALAHIAGALQILLHIMADLETLRERVALPALAGEAIPLSVHVKSIQETVESLREGRQRAKKLQNDSTHKVLGG